MTQSELRRLKAHDDDPDYPLRAIGMREVKSMNSWLHNSPRMTPKSRRHCALLNPGDAVEHGITDGDVITIRSRTGEITITARINEDIVAGAVAIPHGWGHDGGWQYANDAGGVNSNILASGEYEDIEAISGMSILNGIPVQIESSAIDPTQPNAASFARN